MCHEIFYSSLALHPNGVTVASGQSGLAAKDAQAQVIKKDPIDGNTAFIPVVRGR